MTRFLAWTAQHPWRFIGGALILSAALVAIELLLGPGKYFWLLPYPTRDPRTWITLISTLVRASPWLATAVLVVPVGALTTLLVARRMHSKAVRRPTTQ